VRLLLDTHVFVWAALAPQRLSDRVRALLVAPENVLLLSACSAYEIEFKRSRDPVLGRLPSDLVTAAVEQRFEWLAVNPAHAIRAGKLPRLHGDPFDRLLVAQAIEEGVALLTVDARIERYGIPTIW
jgi:PIN domain nuclease of toxin-antitoxin system